MFEGKTAMAFRFSAERLFDFNDHIYMWTFTFPVTLRNDEECMRIWNRFHQTLKWHFPLIKGLRVVEIHTNEVHFNATHGIHFHVLVNHRISYDRMAILAKKAGFGRIHVTPCENAGAALYLSKYLWKDNQIRFRARRWGPIGGFRHTRVKDVEYVTVFTANRFDMFGARQVSFNGCVELRRLTDLYGSWKSWAPDTFCSFADNEGMRLFPHGWRFAVEWENGRVVPGLRSVTQAVLLAARANDPQDVARIWRGPRIVAQMLGNTVLHVTPGAGDMGLPLFNRDCEKQPGGAWMLN